MLGDSIQIVTLNPRIGVKTYKDLLFGLRIIE